LGARNTVAWLEVPNDGRVETDSVAGHLSSASALVVAARDHKERNRRVRSCWQAELASNADSTEVMPNFEIISHFAPIR